MKATSHYHFSLFFPLQETGFFVCVDALSVKKFFDEDLRRAKNDKKDSIKSAMFCCEKWNQLLEFQPQESTRNSLLFLTREYSKNVHMQSRLKIQLSGLVDKTFVGLKSLVNTKNRFALLLDIYEKYWHDGTVLSIRRKAFTNDIEVLEKMGTEPTEKLGKQYTKMPYK